MSSMEAFAASGRAPKRVVDGGHDWREKRHAGEDVAGQNKAKTRIGEYQRARGSSAVLRVALASAFTLGRGGFTGGDGSWQRARDGEGQRGGARPL